MASMWPQWAKCVSCWEDDRDPVMFYGNKDFFLLTCCHFMCQGCMDQLRENSHEPTSCPSCKRGLDMTEEIGSGMMTVKPFEFIAEEKGQESLICTLCIRKGIAVSLCRECDKLLCSLCTEHHPYAVTTASHAIIPLAGTSSEVNNNQQKCETHGKEIDGFCNKCEQFVCTDCYCHEDRRHQVVEMDQVLDVWEKAIENSDMEDMIQKLKEKQKQVKDRVEYLLTTEKNGIQEEARTELTRLFSKVMERDQEINKSITEEGALRTVTLDMKLKKCVLEMKSAFQFARFLETLKNDTNKTQYSKTEYLANISWAKEMQIRAHKLLSKYTDDKGASYFELDKHFQLNWSDVNDIITKKIPNFGKVTYTYAESVGAVENRNDKIVQIVEEEPVQRLRTSPRKKKQEEPAKLTSQDKSPSSKRPRQQNHVVIPANKALAPQPESDQKTGPKLKSGTTTPRQGEIRIRNLPVLQMPPRKLNTAKRTGGTKFPIVPYLAPISNRTVVQKDSSPANIKTIATQQESSKFKKSTATSVQQEKSPPEKSNACSALQEKSSHKKSNACSVLQEKSSPKKSNAIAVLPSSPKKLPATSTLQENSPAKKSTATVVQQEFLAELNLVPQNSTSVMKLTTVIQPDSTPAKKIILTPATPILHGSSLAKKSTPTVVQKGTSPAKKSTVTEWASSPANQTTTAQQNSSSSTKNANEVQRNASVGKPWWYEIMPAKKTTDAQQSDSSLTKTAKSSSPTRKSDAAQKDSSATSSTSTKKTTYVLRDLSPTKKTIAVQHDTFQSKKTYAVLEDASLTRKDEGETAVNKDQHKIEARTTMEGKEMPQLPLRNSKRDSRKNSSIDDNEISATPATELADRVLEILAQQTKDKPVETDVTNNHNQTQETVESAEEISNETQPNAMKLTVDEVTGAKIIDGTESVQTGTPAPKKGRRSRKEDLSVNIREDQELQFDLNALGSPQDFSPDKEKLSLSSRKRGPGKRQVKEKALGKEYVTPDESLKQAQKEKKTIKRYQSKPDGKDNKPKRRRAKRKKADFIPTLDPLKISVESENDDYCSICRDGGGDLLCCDNCPKIFHLDCHIPSFSELPDGEFTCNLCRPKVDALDAAKQPTNHLREVDSGGIQAEEGEFYKACKFLSEVFNLDNKFEIRVVIKGVDVMSDMEHSSLSSLNTIKERLTHNKPEPYKNAEELVADLEAAVKDYWNIFKVRNLSSEIVRMRKFHHRFSSLVKEYYPKC